MYFFDWNTFWNYLWPVTALQNPLIRNGLIVTIVVSIIAQAVGVILGLVRSPRQDGQVRALCAGSSDAYIWYFRGTPLLVQMMLLFFGLGVTHIYDFPDIHLGLLTITVPSRPALLALAINEGAYMAEIVRAGIEAIDPGQMEAAKSLGMTLRHSHAAHRPAAGCQSDHPAPGQRIQQHDEDHFPHAGHFSGRIILWLYPGECTRSSNPLNCSSPPRCITCC